MRRDRMAHSEMVKSREILRTNFRFQRKKLIVAKQTSTSLDIFSPDIKEEDLTLVSLLIFCNDFF